MEKTVPVGLIILHLHFPGCSSLKEKRGYLKPILSRLHRELNVSTAEMDYNDIWQDALIACAIINKDRRFIEKVLHIIPKFIEDKFPKVMIRDEIYEVI